AGPGAPHVRSTASLSEGTAHTPARTSRPSPISLSHPSPTPTPLPSFPTRRSSDLIRTTSSACTTRIRRRARLRTASPTPRAATRSEEHTSELQSPYDLVCRLLLEKKTNPAMCTICTPQPPQPPPHSQSLCFSAGTS